ncbi:MAG TPA: hypothetical protein VIH90_05725 [Candidatus Saccharimonadales bacterium]
MIETVQTFDRILEDPVGAYEALRNRLDQFGPNAPFPEFGPAVDYVSSELISAQHRSVLADHPDLELEQKEVDTFLAHINLTFDFDDEGLYPYGRPFEAPYPYRPTIDAIESALRLLDKTSRLAPESKAVPLYHFDRYAYHRHSLMADPDTVLIPTAENISYVDFIRTRAVPIGFIGVAGSILRVDRHQQTPVDFWYHDINHERRMDGYLKLSAKRHNANTKEEKLELYASMDDFITENLMPLTEELPDDALEADKAVRSLTIVILYEILHESALTAERDSILSDILREAIPQPFEHMVTNGERPSSAADTEKLRTPTGNLQSGISTMDTSAGKPITIRYFHDRALALLANVYNKLNFGFYDDPASPSETVTHVKYRTAEYLLKAVHEIFDALDYDDGPSDEYLLDLIRSREGSEEKFIYQGVVESEAEKLPHATEPLPATEIIEQIKGLGKKVVTLFGFSYLGYEDPAQVLEQVRERIQAFDPETTAINIGATEEGIGAAYRVAKELGFTTLGVVSTLALTYSGRFSEDVDHIFIVNDESWGGYVAGSDKLVDTTGVFLSVSDEIHAFGGGDNTAVTLHEARRRGIPFSYTPADMNHQKADKDRSADKSLGSTGYKGSAFYALQPTQS